MTSWLHTSDQNSNVTFISSSQSGRIRPLLCAFDDSGLFVVTVLHISLSIGYNDFNIMKWYQNGSTHILRNDIQEGV